MRIATCSKKKSSIIIAYNNGLQIMACYCYAPCRGNWRLLTWRLQRGLLGNFGAYLIYQNPTKNYSRMIEHQADPPSSSALLSHAETEKNAERTPLWEKKQISTLFRIPQFQLYNLFLKHLVCSFSGTSASCLKSIIQNSKQIALPWISQLY